MSQEIEVLNMEEDKGKIRIPVIDFIKQHSLSMDTKLTGVVIENNEIIFEYVGDIEEVSERGVSDKIQGLIWVSVAFVPVLYVIGNLLGFRW
ncbi:hypothetical protein MHB77_31530 [Paenibacillus sp. FSL K6-3166]|uniref:hypothetical protein n=1 Tax=Paenibacillus sp. FSL K6-3166 TaxID=2921492 RepID=UPI0030F63AE6